MLAFDAVTQIKVFGQLRSGGDLPTLKVDGEISVADALVGLGFCASKKEARRLIAQGGARVNDQAVSDEFAMLSVTAETRLSAGKKKHGLLVP